MNKVSLLAASVAIALTGCGGSDSGSSNNNSGVVITGFDGYFKEAVVFEDVNNNGKLDSNDPIIGLTNDEGKVTLTDKQYSAEKNLAIQTIIPGGTVQAELIARDPQLFAGTYTVDMDNPTQAMAHEVVFRTLPGEKVISPLTDLVAIQAGANPTPEKIQAAKNKVNETLGIEGDTAFTDVIAANNTALHKTAQILTESKAQAKDSYSAEAAIAIADKATDVVNDKNNADKLDDPNFKPVIEVNNGVVSEPVINSKLFANESVVKAINTELKPLDSHSINLELPLAAGDLALFEDDDNKNIDITVSVITLDGSVVKNLTTTAINGGKLTISGELTPVRPAYQIKLTATDYNSQEQDKSFGAVTTAFDLQVNVENPAPTINTEAADTIEEWIDSIELYQGVEVQNEQFRIDNLFSDDEKLAFKAYTSVDGLVLELVETQGQTELKITGKPSRIYPEGQTITISAFDGINTTYKVFELDDIEKQPEASIEIDRGDLAELQQEITVQLTTLKVGEAVDADFNITEVFEAQHTSGAIEYYAGTEEDEYATTVPGLKVNVDNNGTLTVSGTPTSATKNGSFVIAAGVNPDADDAVISEYVTITLPNVQPADDVTPPPAGHPLEGKFLHFVEIGHNGTNFAKGWCDSIYLDVNTKTMYWNDRDSDNLSTCDTDMSEFTEGVPYTIVDGKIISQEDGMKMTLDVIKQHSFDDDEHFLVSFTDEEGDEKSTELYSYHTNAQYVEEALNNDVSESQEDANWVDRETFIAMPSEEGANDIVVTELKVSGIVQQFDYQGSPYTSASIYGRNAKTCEILKDIYLDYGRIQVHGDNYSADNYFSSQPQYRDAEGSCYIDFMPLDHSAAIPVGLYTIEATPERTDEAERIIFSFEK
ncbi:TPA: hypothetical protein P0E22_004989 [Vibrio harveyi]|uniref:hypothetical protein n=1 Tax=Vibrio harveyi TaxID=669 RepID=UPI00330DFCC3|nr:hypothetical protein [Vibrio harveyi]